MLWSATNSICCQMYQRTSVEEFIQPGSLCALAAERKSTDMFWCMKIEREGVGPVTDDYGFGIPEWCNYLLIRFLEAAENKKLITYKLIKKITFFSVNVLLICEPPRKNELFFYFHFRVLGHS